MTTVAKVARNTFFGLLGQIAVKAVQLGTAAVLARALNTSGFGDLGYVVAVQSFFLFIGDFGVEKIALKQIARHPERAPGIVGAAMTLRAVLSLGSALLAVLFLMLAAPTARLAWLGALACVTLPLALGTLYPVFYQSHLRVGRAAWLTFLQGALAGGFMLCAAFAPAEWPGLKEYRLELVVAAMAAAPVASLLLSGWLSRRDLRPRLAYDPDLWRAFLREASPLAFNTICIMITLRADQLILRAFRGADALGQYVAAVRLYEAFTIIPAVLLLSGYPLMARYDRDGSARYLETARWSYKILAIFALPLALGFVVLAEPVMRLLYGAPYTPAATALAILMGSLFFSFTGMVTFDAVTAAGRQRIFFALSLITMAVNLALNFALIPRYGVTGAAIAALVTTAVNLPFLAWHRETRPLMQKLLGATWRPLLATGILALLPAAGVPPLPFLLALLPAYFLLLLAMGGIDRKDLALVREALRRSP